MWILPVTRRELADLVTSHRKADVSGVEKVDRPAFDIVRRDVMAAVWPVPPSQFGRLPSALIVPEGSHRDALAWLATYVRDFRPFTAYCRVIEKPTAELFVNGPPVPNLMGMDGICSGLIIGEALTHARGRASILELPISAYSATLSHAISRTLAISGRVFPLDTVAQLWMQAREFTGQGNLIVPPSVILSIWSIALGIPDKNSSARTLFEPANVLAAAWSELMTVGEFSDAVWNRLVEGFPDLSKMRSILELPREQRVQMIDVSLKLLVSTNRRTDARGEFLAGYFISLLGPGTLEHADFIAHYVSVIPTAYLWYGLFAGVNVRGDALPAGNPVAQRIVRDLTIPDRLVDRPRCDVALEEISIHGSGEHLLDLTTRVGRLDIDILPGVTIAVRWPTLEASSEDQFRRAKELEAQHLLMEMDNTMMKCRHLTERLRDVLNANERNRPAGPKRRRGGSS